MNFYVSNLAFLKKKGLGVAQLDLEIIIVDFRFKQDVIFQIHLLKEGCKVFPFSNSLHKILLKSKSLDQLSKENGTCLNRKTTLLKEGPEKRIDDRK